MIILEYFNTKCVQDQAHEEVSGKLFTHINTTL